MSYRGTTIFGDKKFPELKPCSDRHDDDYVSKSESRRAADDRFKKCLDEIVKAETDPKRRRQLKMARAERVFFVRALGWLAWYT